MPSGYPKFFLLVVMGLGILYANSLYAPFYFDDYPNILQNTPLHIQYPDWASIKRIFHENHMPARRISYLSFAFNYWIGGYHPFGYHVLNTLIHVFNTYLVFLFILKTLSLPSLAFSRERAFRSASWAALLWAFHPIQTNATVYIVQRMTSLSTLFFLAAFLIYIRGRVLLKSRKSAIRPYFYFSVAILWWIFSLMCKQNTVFLPFLIFLYDVFFFPSRNSKKKIIIGMAAFLFLFSMTFLQFGGIRLFDGWMKEYAWRNFTIEERLLTEMRVVFHYLGLLFLPDPGRLTLLYDGYPVSKSLFVPWTTWFSLLGLIMAGVSMALSLFLRRPIFAFGLLWYFLNLIVESSVIPLELVFEHRVYLSSIGIFLLVSVGITGLSDRYPHKKERIAFLLSLFLILETFGTVLRNGYWANPIIFFEDAIEKSIDPTRALLNLSLYYNRWNATDISKRYIEKAIAHDPESLNALCVYFLILTKMEKSQDAEEILKKIDRILEKGRYFHHDQTGLDILATHFFDFKKDYHRAKKYIEFSLIVAPHDGLHFRLGVIHLQLNQPEEALKCFERSVGGNPRIARHNFYLSLAYRILGRNHEYLEVMEKVLKLFPSPELIKEMSRIMRSDNWRARGGYVFHRDMAFSIFP